MYCAHTCLSWACTNDLFYKNIFKFKCNSVVCQNHFYVILIHCNLSLNIVQIHSLQYRCQINQNFIIQNNNKLLKYLLNLLTYMWNISFVCVQFKQASVRTIHEWHCICAIFVHFWWCKNTQHINLLSGANIFYWALGHYCIPKYLHALCANIKCESTTYVYLTPVPYLPVNCPFKLSRLISR